MAVSVPASLPTVTGLLLARAGSPEPGLRFEDRRWSWQEHVSECARYAAALRARRTPGRPFHVGVLADNVPEFSFLLGGCAFAGAVLVALNPVRRGEALARDVTRTDCQYVLAEPVTRRCCRRWTSRCCRWTGSSCPRPLRPRRRRRRRTTCSC
jgi:Acyl-CoA synthetases (AMP-forming)/AMP-acid ligases II